MRLEVTTDSGRLGHLPALADELAACADAFDRDTSTLDGVLAICLRALPAADLRRPLTRFSRSDNALDVDLSIAEERLDTATLDQQREAVGPELIALLERGCASRTAPWTPEQRAQLRAASRTMLTALGWLTGRRHRARTLLAAGIALTAVADQTGLDLSEVEDLYADSVPTNTNR
ncbi:MAG: hypothetical protein ACTJHU_04110 [Mycetocola sp.]